MGVFVRIRIDRCGHWHRCAWGGVTRVLSVQGMIRVIDMESSLYFYIVTHSKNNSLLPPSTCGS